MAKNKFADLNRSMGIKVCGDCGSFGNSFCENQKFKVKFPSMESDPACPEISPKKR